MAVRKSVRLDRRHGGSPRRITGGAQPLAAAPAQGDRMGQGCGIALVAVLALFVIGKCSSTPPTSGHAEVRATPTSEPAYVAARSLNCRRAPEAAAPVVTGLARNEQVVVAERRDDWARLSRPHGDCWVSSGFLASAPSGPNQAGAARSLMSPSAPIGDAAGAYALSRPAKASRASSRRKPSRSRRGGGGYDGSGCPCSGTKVCIGPRGGRFCITSGGNKRYGV